MQAFFPRLLPASTLTNPEEDCLLPTPKTQPLHPCCVLLQPSRWLEQRHVSGVTWFFTHMEGPWWGIHTAGPKHESSKNALDSRKVQRSSDRSTEQDWYFLICISHKTLVQETHRVSHMWWVRIKLLDASPRWLLQVKRLIFAICSHCQSLRLLTCPVISPLLRTRWWTQWYFIFQGRRKKIFPFLLTLCGISVFALGQLWCVPMNLQQWITL